MTMVERINVLLIEKNQRYSSDTHHV